LLGDFVRADWTLMRLFDGKAIRSACPLAGRSRVLVAEHCPALGVKFISQPPTSVKEKDWLVHYIAKETGWCAP